MYHQVNKSTQSSIRSGVNSQQGDHGDTSVAQTSNPRGVMRTVQPQPRRVSDYSGNVDMQAHSQGRDLTNKWPRSVSFMDSEKDEEGMAVSSLDPKTVTYSEYSSLHMYPVDPIEDIKSYSSSEMNAFKKTFCSDALRIRELVESHPFNQGTAIRHLISANLLSPEELIGIEKLITGEDIAKARYDHASLILMTQQKLAGKTEGGVIQLAKVSAANSFQQVKKAQFRAALAAQLDRGDKCIDITGDSAKFADVNRDGSMKRKLGRQRAAHSA